MTRKKQGAPQKLNSQNEPGLKSLVPPLPETVLSLEKLEDNMSGNLLHDSESISKELESDIIQNRTDEQPDKDPKNNAVSSCQKLLNFTQNFSFLPNNNTESRINEKLDHSESTTKNRDEAVSSSCINETSKRATILNTQENGNNSLHKHLLKSKEPSPFIQPNSVPMSRDFVGRNTEDGTGNLQTSDLQIRNQQIDAINYASRVQADALKGIDFVSLTAARNFLMDAMQKQLYEHCSNNWMNVQRADNNCLSKSKAERYRWCVQAGDAQQKIAKSNSQSHVTNLKKSANMAGINVTPVQDKLYSTVFTGASKFCCRDCGNLFNTLVDLTVHMSKTGHFRDTNNGARKDESVKDTSKTTNCSKTRKRPSTEDDSQGEKVLTCMGCGDLFESLQDLSVHMMNTGHWEHVPSLRTWSQKQPSDIANHQRKKSLSNFSKKSEINPYSQGLENQFLNRQPLGLPAFFPGVSNPAASAAYASFMYTPWFASLPPSLFPSLYPGYSPYAYSSGIFPAGSLSIPPNWSSSGEDQNFSCLKCKESFKSFQKFVQHLQETSHFSDIERSFLNIPSNSPSSRVDKSNNTEKVCSPGTLVNASTKESEHNTAPSPISTSTICRNNAKGEFIQASASSSTSSLDFIRSLESTIKSAISKVDSGRNSKPITPSSSLSTNQTSFSPFSSSLPDRPKDTCSKPIGTLPSSINQQREPKIQERESVQDDRKTASSSCCSITASTIKELDHFSATNSNSTLNGKLVSHNQSSIQFSQLKDGKSESPLDLTLKRVASYRDDNSSISPKKINFSTASNKPLMKSKLHFESNDNDKTDKSSDISLLESLCQSTSFKSPLQCLNDKMQSLLSSSKSTSKSVFTQAVDISKASSNCSTNLSASRTYKPFLIPDSLPPTSSSNPLQEILKIVNNTDLMKPRNSLVDGKTERTSLPKKRLSTDDSPVDAKKSKLSLLLHDLVMPKDDSPITKINPLQKIKDLVENKLIRPVDDSASKDGKNLDDSSHKTTELRNLLSANPYFHSLLAANLNSKVSSLLAEEKSTAINHCSASSAASALLSLKFSSSDNALKYPSKINGFHQDCTSEEDRKNSNSSPASSDENHRVTLNELQLEAAFAKMVSSGTSRSFINQDFAKSVDLPMEKAQNWLLGVTREFQSRGQLPFLRCHGDGESRRMELLCRRCGFVSDKTEAFATHVQDHVEKEKQLKDSTCLESEGNREIHGNVKTKCTIQGSLCIGPLKSFQKVLSPRKVCDESKDFSKNKDGFECNDVDHDTGHRFKNHPGYSDKRSPSTEEGITVSS